MTTVPVDDRRSAFTLAAGPLGIADFDVLSFDGTEAVNRPYQFNVRCVARVEGEATDQLLGARCRLTLTGVSPRVVHGLVTRIVHEGSLRDGTFLSLQIAPRVGFLSRRKTSRIFQDKTVPEIVRSVVAELGAQVELLLVRDHAPREYCVQYQETDFAFVRRLLAEEGLFYYFRHPLVDALSSPVDEGREVLVISDSASHWAEAIGPSQLKVRDRSAVFGEEYIHAFHLAKSVREGGVLVRGYDYERPKFVPVADASVQATTGFDVSALRSYDHDRVLEDRAVPPHVAQLRLEELRRASVDATGTSSCRTLTPGHMFTVAEHAIGGIDGNYVAVEVVHRGQQASELYRVMFPEGPLFYENRFRCAPATVAFRPKRRRRALMQVTEMATVVGPKGEEIHTDEMGRIKIQFHWDLEGKHDDKSSCWIRVMQTLAGTAWGSQFIPRIGMEVVVTFTGGDTDRPVVIGCVYNGATPTPFPLPAEKTKSGLRTRSSPGGAGYNELSFEDQAGSEQIYLHAERDFDEVVERDHTRTVYGREVVNVKESRMVDVAQDNIRVVRGSEVLVVEKDFVLHVAGKKLIQVGTPPAPEEREHEDRGLPEEGSAYAVFHALASLPMFEDDAAKRVSKIRSTKMMFFCDQLEGDDLRAGEFLCGAVADVDKRLEGLCGAVHLLTQDIEELPERLREPPPGVEPVSAAKTRAEELVARADDLTQRIDALRSQNAEPIPQLEKLQKLADEHLATKEPRIAAVRERLSGFRELLEDPAGLITGRGRGGGGADEKFKSAPIAFQNYYEDKDKPKGKVEEKEASTLNIEEYGQIVAKKGFRIECGGSSIELTPGSISIKSSGPVKVNGSEVLLNC